MMACPSASVTFVAAGNWADGPEPGAMKETVRGKSMEPVLPFELRLDEVRTGGLTKALHRALRDAILERRLPAGQALPSTRQLAARLGVGRNTVVAAYDQLVGAGYARSRPGARLVVVLPHGDGTATRRAATARRKPPVVVERASDLRIAAVWRQPAQRIVYEPDLPARCFRTGVPEHRYFDHETWRRLTTRVLREAARSPFQYGPAQGLPSETGVICMPARVTES